jgi:hypothetical protein
MVESHDDMALLRNLLKEADLSQSMVETIYSILLSGKRIVLAFNKNIKSKDAVKVFQVLDKLKDNPHLSPATRRLLQNIIRLNNFATQEELYEKLAAQGIDMDEKDVRGDAKNLMAIFAPTSENEKFQDLERRENVFSAYIDEGKEMYSLEYYPLPEIVTITLSNMLDKLSGVDRLTIQENVIKEIVTENGVLALSSINIEKVERKDARHLIFTLLPKATRYDFERQRDRYALVESLIESAA